MPPVSRRAKFTSLCPVCKQTITEKVDVVARNAAGNWTHDKCAELPVLDKMAVPNPHPSQRRELSRQRALTVESRRQALAKMSWYNR